MSKAAGTANRPDYGNLDSHPLGASLRYPYAKGRGVHYEDSSNVGLLTNSQRKADSWDHGALDAAEQSRVSVIGS